MTEGIVTADITISRHRHDSYLSTRSARSRISSAGIASKCGSTLSVTSAIRATWRYNLGLVLATIVEVAISLCKWFIECAPKDASECLL
jgi:hypothetical protein